MPGATKPRYLDGLDCLIAGRFIGAPDLPRVHGRDPGQRVAQVGAGFRQVFFEPPGNSIAWPRKKAAAGGGPTAASKFGVSIIYRIN